MALRRLTKPRPRRPGRPAENAADLRERLLDAALACFTSASIAATSLSSIARQAGVTPALVNYYFGDKPRLVAAVVQERLLPVVVELQSALGSPATDPSAMLRGFVHGVHALVARHPWLPVIWVREILTEGGALRELMLSQFAPMVPRALAARLAKAQQAGALNADLDPRLLVVSLIGLTLFPLAAESLWRRIFNADDIDSSLLQSHTLALLERGLETRHG